MYAKQQQEQGKKTSKQKVLTHLSILIARHTIEMRKWFKAPIATIDRDNIKLISAHCNNPATVITQQLQCMLVHHVELPCPCVQAYQYCPAPGAGLGLCKVESTVDTGTRFCCHDQNNRWVLFCFECLFLFQHK